MTLTIYQSADAYWDAIAPWRMDSLTNNMLVGLAARQRGEGPQTTALLAILSDGDKPVMAAIRTPPMVLLISDGPLGAARRLARALADRHPDLPGVSGPATTAQAFATEWCAGQPYVISKTMDMQFYRLERFTPPPSSATRFRLGELDDVALAADWHQRFAQEAGLSAAEREPAHAQRAARSLLSQRRQGLLEADGAPVAIASYSAIGEEGARIGGVFTPPELRGRGYGSAITAALSQHLQNQGRWVSLFTDTSNPTSNKIYQRIGFRPHSRHAMVHWAS